MKKLEILHPGTTTTKLTVTPDRITIKLRDGLSSEEAARVTSFLTRVAESLDGELQSMRGNLRGGAILMHNSNKSVNHHFTELEAGS